MQDIALQRTQNMGEQISKGLSVPVPPPLLQPSLECRRDGIRVPGDRVTVRLKAAALWLVCRPADHPQVREITSRLHATALDFAPRVSFQVPSTPQSPAGEIWWGFRLLG